ncbi:MAG: hypothetical protein KKG09_05785 [Verrucomicrobia bacterium]|nr:hypothetical protein [Verrucomicrobiota bacterium]MCG2681501.1 hypothetical protein [Kiritimatiellia bacterium]MBU4248265.1 hypothetical protein [Verrucomicrobiota bacterium]MBU4289881.1 hypothetical protein [Verrucomicrobiota bacterium]MBU4428180.1 hypothetical protein [Verrucomicrobiota bacterium]
MTIDEEYFDRLINPLQDRMMKCVWRVLQDRDSAKQALQEVLLQVWKQTFVINMLAPMVKKSDLQAKMERIIIPELNVQQAAIGDVIQYINQRSIELDTEKSPGERGVNIILKLQPSAQPPVLTLSLKNVSLMDTIRYVTELVGLQFRIDDNAVVIENSQK